MNKSRSLIKISLILIVLIVLPSGVALAGATINVDSTADTLIAGDSNCTLREAIINANNDADSTGGDCPAGSGDDVINLPVGTYILSLAGSENLAATGDLDILAANGSITIIGASPTTTIIQQTDTDRVFQVLTTANLTLKNLRVTGGNGVPGAGINQATASVLLIDNVEVVSNNALTGRAGGIYVYDASLTVQNNSQIGKSGSPNLAGAGAGIFAESIGSGSIVIIDNSSVDYNVQTGFGANDGGGGIFFQTDTTVITIRNNSSVSNNTADERGGGIQSRAGSGNGLTITDSVINDNFSLSHGGGLYLGGETVTFSNAEVSGNVTGANGGGIYSLGTLEIINDSVIGANGNSNEAVGSGGGIYSNGGVVNFTKSTLAYNDTGARGGGVYLENGSTLTVSASAVSNNTSVATGGGIYLQDATATITDSTISENTASDGGGVYLETGSTLTVSASTVSNNTADDGAGIYNERSAVTINKATKIFGNSQLSNAGFDGGGGIYHEGGTMEIINSKVYDNTAVGYGGGVSAEAQLTISGSTISGNTAGKGGGGIYIHNATLTINNYSVIDNNTATGTQGGGGILHLGSAVGDETRITDSTISNNRIKTGSAYGAGFYASSDGNNDSQVFITNTLISGNVNETRDGGGIVNYGSFMYISASLITGNTATRDGGIGAWDSTQIANSTISGNTATVGDAGGIGFEPGSYELYNVTITNNTSPYSGGIHILSAIGTTVSIHNSIVAGNTGTTANDCLEVGVGSTLDLRGEPSIFGDLGACVYTDDANMINLDPLLEPLAANGGFSKTHALLVGSPAINAGSGANAQPTDQRGAPAVGTRDLGAFESGYTVSTGVATCAGKNLQVDVSAGLGAFTVKALGPDFTQHSVAVASAPGSATLPSSDAGDWKAIFIVDTNGVVWPLGDVSCSGAVITTNTTATTGTTDNDGTQTFIFDENGGSFSFGGRVKVNLPANVLGDGFDYASCTISFSQLDASNLEYGFGNGESVFDIHISCAGSAYSQLSAPITICIKPTDGSPGDKQMWHKHQGNAFEVLSKVSGQSGWVCSTVDQLSLFTLGDVGLPATGFAQGVVSTTNAAPANGLTFAGEIMLEIPQIGLRTSIAGVPQTPGGWDVSWLGEQVGYLYGTAFPTWAGNTVLTGHVWDADDTAGIFYGIDQLQHGDRFYIYAWGQTFTYEVHDNFKTYDSNLKPLVHSDYDMVTLLTCESFSEFTGEYRYRRAVQAVLIAVD